MDNTRDPRGFIFLLLIFFLISNQNPQPVSGPRSWYDRTLEHEYAALDVLNASHYGDMDAHQDKWLNITGLRKEDGYAWTLLEGVKQKALGQLNRQLGSKAERVLNGTVLSSHDQPVVYHNVSGYVQGDWARSKLGADMPAPQINFSAIFPESPYTITGYDRNISAPSGGVRLHFSEKEGDRTAGNSSVVPIKARMIMNDDESFGDSWDMTLFGLHFPHFGSIILTTTSEKFGGIFALPQFVLSDYTFGIAKELLIQAINETIERQSYWPGSPSNPWSSAPEGSTEGVFADSHCEFVVYLQQHEVAFTSFASQDSKRDSYLLELIEKELRAPEGLSAPSPSPLTMSMVAFSPDCGFVVESKGPPDFTPEEGKHLVGMKVEGALRIERKITLIFGVLMIGSVLLVKRQMQEASTPSTRSRISFYTVAMMSLGDGFAFMAFTVDSLISRSFILALYAVGYLSFLSGTLFGMRFLIDIWIVQATERRRQERQASNAATAVASATNTTTSSSTTQSGRQGASPANTGPSNPPGPPPDSDSANGLPLPVTATPPRDTGATPIILLSDQDTLDAGPEETVNNANNRDPTSVTGHDLRILYLRVIFFLMITLFLSAHSLSWPGPLRSAFINTLTFLYLSFWVPQIYRNIMRNCRRALRWEFVVGQSILRLIPIIYIYAMPDNIVFSETDTQALCILLGWQWLQVFTLKCQEVLGPRFFIREGWAPPAYDYHPVLREDEEGASMPVGLSVPRPDDEPSSSKPGEAREKGKRVFDCTICAQDIEVAVIPLGGTAADSSSPPQGLAGGLLERRKYMVTPCRHIFHTPCLEGWMRYRLLCPNCREVLPPL